jgi:hypothetical protein
MLKAVSTLALTTGSESHTSNLLLLLSPIHQTKHHITQKSNMQAKPAMGIATISTYTPEKVIRESPPRFVGSPPPAVFIVQFMS